MNTELREFEKRFDRFALDSEELSAMKGLYALYEDEAMLWMAGLYDHETGGFYYSNSARDNDGFLPDIEDTAFVLADLIGPDRIFVTTEDMLSRLAARNKTDFASRLVSWVRSMQSPENGFYYHPQWGTSITDVGLFRHFNMANRILERFGEEPLYTQNKGNDVKADRSALPAYMQSKEALVAWLDGFDWSPNMTYHSASVVGEMAATLKEIGLIDTVCDYFDAMQTENGTFEHKVDKMSCNGVMKVCQIYRAAGRSFKRFEALLDTVMTVMTREEPTVGLICSAANLWTLLGTLRHMTLREIDEAKAKDDSVLPAEATERLRIFRDTFRRSFRESIERTTERFAVYKKPDHGFSLLPETCGARTVGVEWSLKVPESDVNGTNLAIGTLATILTVAELPRIPIFSPKAREGVLDILATPRAAT